MLAGFLRSDEEKAGGGAAGLAGVGEERIGQRLGYGLRRDEVRLEADGFEGAGGGWAYGGDVEAARKTSAPWGAKALRLPQ